MIIPGTLKLLAAMISAETFAPATSRDASLSVTATVVRLVIISNPLITSKGVVVTVRNSAAVELRADGAKVSQLDQNTTIITSSRAGLTVITVIY